MKKEVRDRWERRALRIFRTIYRNQFSRTRRAVTQADLDQIRQAIDTLYQGEPARVRAEVRKLYDDMAADVSRAALRQVNATADQDALTQSIFRLSNEASDLFSHHMTQTSYRLVLSIHEDWLTTPGDTLQNLIDRMERIWTGPRPDMAATTEATRLSARVQRESWVQSGVVEMYRVITRNDSRVRPRHQEIADNGPYPITDTEHLPPFGDVNCRCFVSPVVRES